MKIGIETDRGQWASALIAAGYQVFAINPLPVARYRERHSSPDAEIYASPARPWRDPGRLGARRIRRRPAPLHRCPRHAGTTRVPRRSPGHQAPGKRCWPPRQKPAPRRRRAAMGVRSPEGSPGARAAAVLTLRTPAATQLAGVPAEPSEEFGPVMLTSQLTPNLSVHIPKLSPHGAGPSGMPIAPPADNFSQ